MANRLSLFSRTHVHTHILVHNFPCSQKGKPNIAFIVLHCVHSSGDWRVKETAAFETSEKRVCVSHLVNRIALTRRTHTLSPIEIRHHGKLVYVSRGKSIHNELKIRLLFGSFARTSHANALYQFSTRSSAEFCVPFLDGNIQVLDCVA